MKGKFTLAVVSVLCSFAVHINAQTSCSAITGTGCNLDGPVSGTGNSCLDYTFDLPALPPLPYCTLDFDTFSGDCQANFAAGVTAPPTGLSAAAFCALLVSDCCSTPSPTFQPTNSPTRSPSPAPSKLPTPSPTGNPTLTPTRTPTTLAPSNSPSPNPTSAPQVAAPGFFEVQENVYMVSGIGGGVLLLAIAGALFMRSRRQGGSASKAVMEEPKTSPEMRGKKGLTPSLKVKIEQEVENSIFDWEKHIDKTSGEVYFFNPKTNESRWDPPEIVSKTAKKILENVSKEL